MKLRFVLLLFFSFGMLSCASQPKEVKSQRIIYGVIQQPSAEGGMFILCANCNTVTPKTPIAKQGPISFVSPRPLYGHNQRLIETPSITYNPVAVASPSDVATESVKLKTDVQALNTNEPSKLNSVNRNEASNIKDIKEAKTLNGSNEGTINENNNVSVGNKEDSKKIEEKKAIVYFNGGSIRPERASIPALNQISLDARNVGQVALRARMAKTGSLQERIALARARSVEVRQELINRGVAAKKLRAYYHADCCWIGDPANPSNNRVEVMLEPTNS